MSDVIRETTMKIERETLSERDLPFRKQQGQAKR